MKQKHQKRKICFEKDAAKIWKAMANAVDYPVKINRSNRLLSGRQAKKQR